MANAINLKFMKSKKGAAELFNLIIPILLFMLVAVVIWILFNFINGSFTREDPSLTEGVVSTNHTYLPTLLSARFPFKDEGGRADTSYNISLYEIIYYRNGNYYKTEIDSYLNQFGQTGLRLSIYAYKTSECRVRGTTESSVRDSFLFNFGPDLIIKYYVGEAYHRTPVYILSGNVIDSMVINEICVEVRILMIT